MFDKEYVFYGKHADIVNKLTSKLSDDVTSIFQTNYAVYKIAPVIGVMFNRKAEIDRPTGANATKVFADKMMSETENLKMNFRWIMTFIYKDKMNSDELETLLFKMEKDDEMRKPYDLEYNSYVLGGLEILDEKIFSGAKDVKDYVRNIFEFIEEYQTRYYSMNS